MLSMENKITYENIDKVLLKIIPEFQDIFDDRREITENWKSKYIVFVALYEFLEKIDLTEVSLTQRIWVFISHMVDSQDQNVQDLLKDFFGFIYNNKGFELVFWEAEKKLYYKRVIDFEAQNKSISEKIKK